MARNRLIFQRTGKLYCFINYAISDICLLRSFNIHVRDSFKREINYLRVSITDRCNLHCTYCRPKDGISLKGHDDILRYEEIIRIVNVAVRMGLIKVRVTGGEPLVRRGFLEFIASLKMISALQDISITTNGILLEDFAQNIFSAGIRRINISLDSLNKEKYARITGGGDLDAVLRGIKRAEKIGFSPIKINTVAIRGFNDNEIMDFARLAYQRPFQIRFIELMPIGQAHTKHSENYLPANQLLDKIAEKFTLIKTERKKAPTDGPAQIFKLEGGAGEIGLISPVSVHFCSTCNRLRLTADGKLRSCLLRDDEVDLKSSLRENCSDAELESLIRQAVSLKSDGHEIACTVDHLRKCQRDMSAIGG
ncbi:MAG TPA: GTP 3',8-cyclase MoaA [Smithellaceae bacterium]|nr:GTP 3',8-cyclase MoaA [Smithellaceae bacterium]HRS88433.1 GTP 3',8-cyclase MoaA [Smithellaceae bacterium]HRV25489.1 GTP 3',8-cyclase MoaA [Smithellaceae bacterium]